MAKTPFLQSRTCTFHQNYNMGLTSLIKTQTQVPSNLTLQQCQQLLRDTAQLLNQNKLDLKLLVHFSIDSLKYRSKGWRKSTVSLYISNFGLKGETHPQGGECILEMEQIYEIHELVKHFRKQKSTESQPTQTAKGDQNERECCICLDEKATTMLPCGHSYCIMCTSKYIIEQEEHRCPQCRRQFRGNSQSLKREFYEVIGQDKIVYQQARRQILEQIGRHSPKIMQLLEQEAQKFSKR